MTDTVIPPVVQQGVDPVDQYLTGLQLTKNYVDANLPRLASGVDAILNSSVGQLIPNGIPKNGAIDRSLGSNRGMPNFNPGANQPKSNGSLDFVRNTVASLSIPGMIPEKDAISKSRPVGFASGPDRNNFERYYYHPKFKELGFIPNADNETLYNEKSTWADDFNRAASQWGDLAGLGFTQTSTNWDDLFTLNTAGDTKNARDMNKMMSIASSSRGGLGGFVTNQFANSAYTMGVMSNIVLEELALLGATAATEGLLGSAAVVRTGQNIKKLLGLAKAGDIAGDAAKATKVASETIGNLSTGSALNNVADISQARKFWNGVGNFVTPFGQTTTAVKNLRTGANGFDKLSDFAQNSKVFGAFFRDVQLMNTTLAESRLEGGFVENEVFDGLMADYYKNNVEPPDDAKANEILNQAKAAGVKTTMANAPAIFFSNKIVFEKALNGFSAFRNVGKGSLGTMATKTINKGGKKTTLYEGFLDGTRSWMSVRGMKTFGKQFLPKNLAKHGLRYMSANLAEGLQEVYQEGIAETMKNYYLDTYFGPERAGSATFMSHLNDGFGKQWSGQGAETFLSGFLMGGLVQGPQKLVFQTIPQTVSDFRKRAKDPVKYEAAKAQRTQAQQQITDFLNYVASTPKAAIDPIYANLKAQKDFAELSDIAETAGDKKGDKDARQDSLFTHVSRLIESGYLDLFTQQVDTFKQMKDDELLQAFGYEQSDGSANEFNKSMREKLDGINGKVKDIQKRHEKYASIQNPFNRDSDDPIEMYDYQGFEAARRMAVYNEYTFDKANERMTGILKKAATYMSNVEAGRITSIFGKDQLDKQLLILQREIDAYEGGDTEQLKIQKQKQNEYAALSKLKAATEVFRDSLDNAKKGFNKDRVKQVQKTEKLTQEIDVDTEVEYVTDKKEKIQGKVVAKTGKQVTIEYTDKKGKVKTKQVSINSTSLSIAGKEDVELEYDEEVTTRAVEQDKDYVAEELRNYISQLTGLDPNDVRMNGLIYDYIDYQNLSQDADSAMAAVNNLNDPGYFSLVGQMHSKAMQDAMAIAKEKINTSLAEFQRRMETNAIAKDIYEKFKVFFDPNEMKDLLEGKKFPTTFYDAYTKQPIDTSTGKYKDIVEYILDYEEANLFEMQEKPIVEQEGGVFGPYKKGEGPRFKDLMKDLGLDPKSDEIQTIKLADLLDYVIKNKLGTVANRRLAQILKEKSGNEQIGISLKEPGPFSYSKEAGIVIDPRYAAIDYNELVLPIDYMVLAPFFQKVVIDNTTDTAFNKALDDAMAALKAHYEQNQATIAEDDRQTYQYMMASKEDFVTLAMASPQAQKILESISYQTTTKNLWAQLLDDIMTLLSKVIPGFKSQDSVLKEVLGVISNKIENQPITPRGTTTDTGSVDFRPSATTMSRITIDTPIDDMPQDLQLRIKVLFNEYKKANPGTTQSDFPKFVSSSVDVKELIQRYNIENGLMKPEEAETFTTSASEEPVSTTAGTFTPTTPYGTTTGPEVTTSSTAPVSTDAKADIEAKKAEYKREDFPESQSNTRTPITQKLLDYFAETLGIPKFTEDLSKGTYVSWLQNANPIGYAVAEKLNAPKQAFDVIAKYDAELDALEGAKPTEEGLGKIETAPNPKLVETAKKFGFTEEHVKAMSKDERLVIATATSKEDVKDLIAKYITPTKAAINPEIYFDNIPVGTILERSDKALVTVTEKDSDKRTITVKAQDSDTTFVISEKDLTNQITKLVKKPDQKVEPIEVISLTSEEMDLSNEDVDSVVTTEMINEAKTMADELSNEEVNNEFLNDLEC